MNKLRGISQTITGIETTDGAGVKLKRILGSPDLNYLDPFLLFDEFRNDASDDYNGGFPDHPHRGFETVTYMKQGRMRHRDSVGNEGLLTAGSVQWMTAGRGIIHSEMPEQEDGLMWGYQLWVNLPKKLKMTEPRYQDIPPEDIPVHVDDGFSVRVIAGKFEKISASAETHIPIHYLDVELKNEHGFNHTLPETFSGFIYVYEGDAAVGTSIIPKNTFAVLDNGNEVSVSAENGDVQFLLIAGEPLNEPIARGGPFVMNTKGEVLRAFEDYQNGVLDKRP
ncbi:MAG: pirin family protein [Candidatus Marinimicrobia bacterium]|nr:pirin family protein [Candidatus Neomarinimicrobiota bacterium]MDP7071803.1 pirin family protein [Candidatus Neomarinimicrobiota bacterium]